MKSVFNATDRRHLTDRITRLSPEDAARWGKMNAPQMVVHLSDSLRMAFGELEVTPKNGPLRFTPLKQLVVYWLPFPKGVPTAPELIARVPGQWPNMVAELRALLDRLASRDPAARWPSHPAFGVLSTRQWGVLIYRHIDHHLRQFGV